MSDREVPPPDDDFPKWFDDPSASREVRNWDNEGILKGQEEVNHLWWLRAYGFLVIVFLLVFAALFLGSLISWAAHYMLPQSYHWLTSEHLPRFNQCCLVVGLVVLCRWSRKSNFRNNFSST